MSAATICDFLSTRQSAKFGFASALNLRADEFQSDQRPLFVGPPVTAQIWLIFLLPLDYVGFVLLQDKPYGVFCITFTLGALGRMNDMLTNPHPKMRALTARVDAVTLAAFDALAQARGGRSAMLRQLIDQAAKGNGDTPVITSPEGKASNRISLRFTDTETAVIAHKASQRSTDRSRWIKALVRRHLALKSHVDDGLLAELAPIRMQLLRIGRNLNQAMKAANASMLETGDKQIGGELKRIADMRMEISEQIVAVGDAMRGDASYWTVAD
jgi:hypothetical protein